jgi:hypothetical protein
VVAKAGARPGRRGAERDGLALRVSVDRRESESERPLVTGARDITPGQNLDQLARRSVLASREQNDLGGLFRAVAVGR